MAAAEKLRAAQVEEHEAGRAALQRRVHVPAVGFELEQAREMLPRLGGAPGGNIGHRRTRRQGGHVDLLLAADSVVRDGGARPAVLPSFGNTPPTAPSPPPRPLPPSD